MARLAFIGGEVGFYVVRLLLGAAEAGFFPSTIFYLTLWFPASYRARIVSMFMAAIPLSSVIGAPVSGALLGMDGLAGLKCLQWLFIIEAVPALIPPRRTGSRRTNAAGPPAAWNGAPRARTGAPFTMSCRR